MTTALEVYRRRLVAQERKKIHESSQYIYPMREKNNNVKQAPRKTSYTIDFAKKEGKPAKPRPCSVTRRNRPHPSKNFLNWRIPSQPMPVQKNTCKNNKTIEAFLNLSELETKEGFYDDYVGRYKSQKCNYCQDMGSSPPRYSTKSRFLKRAEYDEEEASGSLPRCIIPPLCMSKDAGHKYDTLVAKTSSRERMIIESCLDAGDRGYLGKSLGNAIQAEAIPAIHRWLKSQNASDRNTAVGFLSNLSKSTSVNKDQTLDRKACQVPLSLGKNTSAEISKAARDVIIDQVRQVLPKDAHLRDRRRQPRYSLPSNKKIRIPKCPPRGFVMNKGALFMQPHRCLPGHFEIHPEFERTAK